MSRHLAAALVSRYVLAPIGALDLTVPSAGGEKSIVEARCTGAS